MREKVYVETTIPSFYHETRTDPGIVARRNWTQHWWDFKRETYEVVTSVAVVDELGRGDYPTRTEALALLEDIPLLKTGSAVVEIVEAYIHHCVMPADPGGDALHLALASFNKCEFLLTWNCRHLANANKLRHIRRVNGMLGLYVPNLVTPLEFLDEEE